MKRIVFAVVLLIAIVSLFAPTPAAAQAGTPSFFWDPSASMKVTTFYRDSCSAADSDFVEYSPPTNEYFRGFYIMQKSGFTALFRFVRETGADNPAIDSTVTPATVAIGNHMIFVSQKPNPKVQLLAGAKYRINYIPLDLSHLPQIRLFTFLVTSKE